MCVWSIFVAFETFEMGKLINFINQLIKETKYILHFGFLKVRASGPYETVVSNYEIQPSSFKVHF